MDLQKGFIQIILLISSICIIVFFLPRDTKFKYQYQEGKPWKYDLLTTTFDFPIQKTDEELKNEEDSVMKSFQPYFWLDKDIVNNQKQLFQKQYDDIHAVTIPIEYYDYVDSQLDKIYETGIISSEKHKELEKEHISSIILLVAENKGKEYPLNRFYTAKTAYDFILEKLPEGLEKRVLYNLNIYSLLENNIIFDEKKTEELKANLLNGILKSSGMVQAGVRIIDRGEIVDKDTYKILNSLRSSYDEKHAGNAGNPFILLGQLLLTVGLMVLFFSYLYLFRPLIYEKRLNVFFLFLMITLFSIIPPILGITLNYIYIIPFTILPIIVRTFFDSRTALMAYIIAIFINALSVPFPFEFVLLQFITGVVSVYTLKDLTQRSQIFGCAIFVFFAYAFIYTAYVLLLEGSWSKINGWIFAYFLVNALLLLFAYPLIYLFEKVFGFVSSVTLVELSNINNPILRKLSEVAPGTFHHSLQVSNLATEAASKIEANVQLVRTGALYHDIGKITNPAYFTENQAKGNNPHNELPFEKSAEIIIQHVKDGLKIADKIRLPQQVKDFIATHHGKGKAKYFYHSFKNQYPDKPVNEELFTYPGPNPFSKETALMMMADSVEAASRSLPEYNNESITKLVNQIIDTQMEDGLLKNAPLSFKEIELIKQIFIQKLKTIYHTRISYPNMDKEKDAEDIGEILSGTE